MDIGHACNTFINTCVHWAWKPRINDWKPDSFDILSHRHTSYNIQYTCVCLIQMYYYMASQVCRLVSFSLLHFIHSLWKHRFVSYFVVAVVFEHSRRRQRSTLNIPLPNAYLAKKILLHRGHRSLRAHIRVQSHFILYIDMSVGDRRMIYLQTWARSPSGTTIMRTGIGCVGKSKVLFMLLLLLCCSSLPYVFHSLFVVLLLSAIASIIVVAVVVERYSPETEIYDAIVLLPISRTAEP